MVGLDRFPKIYLYGKPCDMRNGFDGLFGLVLESMKLDPLSGYLFVFINGNRNRIKLLYWDHDGLALFYKRLEKGTFKRPSAESKVENNELLQEELYMILRGIDFEKTKKKKRFLLPEPVN